MFLLDLWQNKTYRTINGTVQGSSCGSSAEKPIGVTSCIAFSHLPFLCKRSSLTIRRASFFSLFSDICHDDIENNEDVYKNKRENLQARPFDWRALSLLLLWDINLNKLKPLVFNNSVIFIVKHFLSEILERANTRPINLPLILLHLYHYTVTLKILFNKAWNTNQTCTATMTYTTSFTLSRRSLSSRLFKYRWLSGILNGGIVSSLSCSFSMTSEPFEIILIEIRWVTFLVRTL